jgi:hypothetical protein
MSELLGMFFMLLLTIFGMICFFIYYACNVVYRIIFSLFLLIIFVVLWHLALNS